MTPAGTPKKAQQRGTSVALKPANMELDGVPPATINAMQRHEAISRDQGSGGTNDIPMVPSPKHPYVDIPPRAHWMRSVAHRDPLQIEDWYQPRFRITDQAIATAGSCFAQHIGRRVREAGFRFIDAEPAPGFIVNGATRLEYGYGMYSARYGNVYTPRQLWQLIERAFGRFKPKEDHWIWRDGVVDPFRPTIEPEPFSSVDELRRSRSHHLAMVREVFETVDLFVFTLGLTECFGSRHDGAVYPVAPGVNGGTWDPAAVAFHNFRPEEVLADMRSFLTALRALRPHLQVLVTVSPVPLMATASGEHVAVATMRSKSTLRAAASALTDEFAWVDYFPSYEIIASPAMQGRFFETDMRSVSAAGVDHVMREFFRVHPPPAAIQKAVQAEVADDEAIACDEELMRTFGDRR